MKKKVLMNKKTEDATNRILWRPAAENRLLYLWSFVSMHVCESVSNILGTYLYLIPNWFITFVNLLSPSSFPESRVSIFLSFPHFFLPFPRSFPLFIFHVHSLLSLPLSFISISFSTSSLTLSL